MRKLSVFILVGLVVTLLPSVGWAGEPNGACYVVQGLPTILGDGSAPEGEFAFAGCADDFTEQECSSIDELVLWAPGASCADLALKGNFDWQGSCGADIDPLGNICIQLWTDVNPTFTQGLCENDIGGVWFDDLECGAPVPTMPAIAMAVMVFVLLGGALILLKVRGTLPTS